MTIDETLETYWQTLGWIEKETKLAAADSLANPENEMAANRVKELLARTRQLKREFTKHDC